MTRKHGLLIAAAAAAGFWALSAAAQEEDQFIIEEAPVKKPARIYTYSVEGGGGYSSAGSFKFGEYTGLGDEEFFGIGNLQLFGRDAYDSSGTEYWTITGTNLGLDNRSVRGEYGRQGTFDLYVDYDQIPHLRFDDGRTPYNGVGSDTLTLPSNWVSDTTTDGMTALNSSLKQVDIETERQKLGGGFTWHMTEAWAVQGNYHREYKDGLETVAGIFGTSGGNPRGAILPQAIDQTTDIADVSLSYTGKRFQGELRYDVSLFNNDEESLTWANPFDSLWDASQDFDLGGQGRLAAAPDNQAHMVTLSGGYSLSDTTRVVGNFSYGTMIQDEPFLPFTVNPNLAVPFDLPRADLDGEVNTLHGNLVLTARPMPMVDLKAEYIFDDKDNNTPRDIYLVVRNDSSDQQGPTEDRARINRPYSTTMHKVKLDAGYRFMPGYKVSGGYDFEARSRTFSEVDDNFEHTARAKVSVSPSPYVSGWLGYAFSFRRGSDYITNQPFLDGASPAHLDTLTEDEKFENDPDLEKFYMSDRNRHKVTGAMTVVPHDTVLVGLSGSYVRDDFINTTIGLTESDNLNVTVDLSYEPMPVLMLSTFVAYDQADYEQQGYQRSGGAFPPGSARSPGSFWNVDTEDRVYTVGAGAEWYPIEDMLDIRFDYLYSVGFTEIDPVGGSDLTFAPLPDLVSRWHAVSLSGGYRIHENATIRLGYWFEWFKSQDFALDGVDPATTQRIITLGNGSPDYTAHVVGVSAVFRF